MKALKTKIRGLSPNQFLRLRELAGHSKNLYNQSLWVLRETFEATGQYVPYTPMDKVMKQVTNREGAVNYKLLKAKVSQQILRRLDKNFKSFFNAYKDYQKNPSKYSGQPRPPRFKRCDRDNLIDDYQAFAIKNGVVSLEKGLDFRLPKMLLGKTIKQIEVIPKRNYFEAVLVYDDESDKPKPIPPSDRIMAIDLGLNNLAGVVTNGVSKPWLIDGRRLKAINHHYHKRFAQFTSHLEQTRKKKWSHRLQRLTDRKNARVADYLQKTTSQIVKHCVNFGISQVVIGEVTKSLNSINLGKKTNQNWVGLALGQLVDKLRYKLENHGIVLKIINESYTSKASFVDEDTLPKKHEPDLNHAFSGKRVKRGLYRTRTGLAVNADVNGAYNILRKSNPKFSFAELFSKTNEGILGWLTPCTRVIVS